MKGVLKVAQIKKTIGYIKICMALKSLEILVP